MRSGMPSTDCRVVVTGLGIISPIGVGTAENWSSILRGRSGIGTIASFDASDHPVRIAGEVRDFDPNLFFDKKEIKKVDRFTQLALAASQMALEDSGFRIDDDNGDNVGVVVGVGMGGIATIEEVTAIYHESGLRRVSPFFVPRLIANMAPGMIAIRFGCRGVNYVTTSACASGGHAVGEAFRLVASGRQEMVLAGGSEAPITPLGVGGFAVMRALSTRNEEPERASRPFDRGRDGFVIGEGAGMLVVESLDSARARGARVYAEIVGYGANADAYHMTSPAPEGRGAAQCMRLALRDAGASIDEVDYINAHGTSTPYNDVNETTAVKIVFGDHAKELAISSTKSMTGHLLGGAGGIEAAYTALAVHEGVLPPTINYEEPDPECDLDYVPNRAREATVDAVLSNSFGFGGTNATLLLTRYKGD